MSPRRTSELVRDGRWIMLLLVLATVGSSGFIYARWLYREQRFNNLIEQTAARHNVDMFLVKAVIRRESEFDPFAHGRADEIGLMQVTEAAGMDWARGTGRKDFTKEILWNPATNIEAGTWYLARALRRWQGMDDPLPFALAEYNAGLGNVQRWLPRGRETTASEFVEAITYPTVRRYIETVTAHYEHYKAHGRL